MSSKTPIFLSPNLKKDELKDLCRESGLRVSGTKAELMKRLESSFNDDNEESPTKNGIKANGKMSPVPVKRKRTQSENARKALKEERESIVLWKKPLTTLNYSLRELVFTILEWFQKLLQHKLLLALITFVIGLGVTLYNVEGPHHDHIVDIEKYILWCLWWVGLGVLSSVGLGTGLHTFLLYLGPHIAAVTMAAGECGSVNFPEPPYPDSIICPDGKEERITITIWHILAKVRVEAFCWGAGTALGELPPYFMARAHRLSGYDPDEEEDEFDELQEKLEHPEQLNYFDRAKLAIEKLVEKVGFLGILACASIPNPLFDLAGITCGHFLVPFWTFFGATLIGKAVIKMHIQKIFVILAFNENLITMAVSKLSNVPWVGPKLQGPFKDFLAKQKEKLHQKGNKVVSSDSNIISWVFEKFVLLMVAYFVLSIVNSLAQSYHRRINKRPSVKPAGAIKTD